MTITLIPQLSMQPKDTFEKLRHRLLHQDGGHELVYYRPENGAEKAISGSTSFCWLMRGEPFLRKTEVSTSQSTTFGMWDYSPTGPEATPATMLSALASDAGIDPDYGSLITSVERAAMQDTLLGQRAVNRSFAPLVRAREEEIVAQWTDTEDDTRRPSVMTAPLSIPVVDYLEALGVVKHVHVLPFGMASKVVGSQAWHTPKTSHDSNRAPQDVTVERTRVSDLRPGDVINGWWQSWIFESAEQVTGAHRSCTVLRGRNFIDGEPMMTTTGDPEDERDGFRVLRRAATA